MVQFISGFYNYNNDSSFITKQIPLRVPMESTLPLGGQNE